MNALIEGMREVRASFGEALSSVDSTEALGELRVRNLGKKGALTVLLKSLGKLSPEERPAASEQLNTLQGNMGVGYPVSGFTKFTFTDNEAKDKDTGERRAVTLLVSGGQVSFCANGDSRPACKYDVDLTGATCNEYGGC